jgi:hypothetical protein
VVSFKPRPLYSRRKSPRYPFHRRLSGVPKQVWTRLWGEKIPAGNRISVVQPKG